MAINNTVVREACSHQGENYKWACDEYPCGCIPWCAVFIYAVLKKCNALYAVENFKNTFVDYWLIHFQNNDYELITDFKKVREGDIVIITWNGKSGDHIGFVRANGYSSTEIQTIEGNTTRIPGHDEGSAKNIVNKKTRYKSEVLAIYRPKWNITPEEPKQPKKKTFEIGQKVWFTGGNYYATYSTTDTFVREGKECWVTIRNIAEGKPLPYLVISEDNLEDAYGWVTEEQLDPNHKEKKKTALKKGDKVIIKGTGWSNPSGDHGWTAYGQGWTREVISIYKDSKYPYQIGAGGVTTGFYAESALEKL